MATDVLGGMDVAGQDPGELTGWMARVASAHPQAPSAWVLWHTTPEMPYLLVGLCGESGALWWNSSEADYRPACGGGDGVDYWIGGVHHTQFPAGSEVSAAVVVEVVHEFLRTGVLPTAVRWANAD